MQKTKDSYCEIPVTSNNSHFQALDSLVGTLKIRHGIAMQIAMTSQLLKSGVVLYPTINIENDGKASILSFTLGNLPIDAANDFDVDKKKLEDANWFSNEMASAK